MHTLTNKQYEEYMEYCRNKAYGKILTPDGLRFICEANDYDAEKIGQHFLEVLARFAGEKVSQLVVNPDAVEVPFDKAYENS